MICFMNREKRVLLVEPDPKLAKKIYLIFQKEGFLVDKVERASEAIRNIQMEHVSVLVMDVDIQDMSWDEAIPIIKGMDPMLPIIVTATQNTPELEANVLHQKIFFYHVKSFGSEELILAVKNALEKPKIYN